MRSFATRSTEAELMDGEAVSAADFAACLASLAAVNDLTRARPPTRAWLALATAGLPRGGEFSLIDVGFGEGDMLRAVAKWAGRRGLRPRLIGYDLNPRSAPAAEAKTDPALGIEYRTGDAFGMTEPVDMVISSLTAHHMTDAEIVRFVQWMEGVSVRGWFINDLHRHPLAFYGFAAITRLTPCHPFVRHDGPVSIARSFRREDWGALLLDAGVDPARVSLRWRFPFRLCVGRLK